MEKILTFVKKTYESSKQKIMSYDDKNVTEKKSSNNIIIKAKSESNLDDLKVGKKHSANICGLPFYKKNYVKGASQ